MVGWCTLAKPRNNSAREACLARSQLQDQKTIKSLASMLSLVSRPVHFDENWNSYCPRSAWEQYPQSQNLLQRPEEMHRFRDGAVASMWDAINEFHENGLN